MSKVLIIDTFTGLSSSTIPALYDTGSSVVERYPLKVIEDAPELVLPKEQIKEPYPKPKRNWKRKRK